MLTALYRTWIIRFFVLFFPFIPVFSTCGHFYAGVSVGPSYAKLGNNNPKISYESGSLITDAYPLSSNRSLSVTMSVNGGYEFMGAHWKPSTALGLGVYFNPQDYHYSGRVIETAAGSASSTLYNYHYKMNSTRAIAEMQLTWILAYVSPFINFGIGAAWNKADSYRETAVSSTGYSPVPFFHSRTNLNFAYQVGLGISAAFNFVSKSDFLRERVSVGYRYVGSGKTSFGTRGFTYPHRLHTGSLTSDDVYFNYTHLF